MARVSNDEIRKFKSEISLVDYIMNSEPNYEVKHALSNGNTTCLENETNGSKIYVSKNKGDYIFKDFKAPVDYKGKGSIIDFIQDYQNKSYTETLYHLRDVMGGYQVEKPNYNQLKNKINDSTIKLSDDYFSFNELKFTKYLNDRGITNDVINSPTFKGRVGQKEISTVSGGTYKTTVFPMYENISGDLIGLEQKNSAFSGSYPGSNKKNGFFKSNVLDKKPNLFISESPIDMMAHYRLKNPKNEKNIMYLGTYGELSESRIQVINDYLVPREHQFNSFTLGMDNDAGGSRFNINIMGNVDFKDVNKDVNFFIKSDKEITKLSVTSNSKQVLEEVKKEVLHIANNDLKLTTNHELQYRSFAIEKKDDNFEMSFLMNTRKSNIEPLEKVVKKFRNSPFEVEKSQSKDFGIDLENKLGIVRSKEPVFNYKNGTTGYIQNNNQEPIKVQLNIDKENQSYIIFKREDIDLGDKLSKLKISSKELNLLEDKGMVQVKPYFKSIWKSNDLNKNKAFDTGLER